MMTPGMAGLTFYVTSLPSLLAANSIVSWSNCFTESNGTFKNMRRPSEKWRWTNLMRKGPFITAITRSLSVSHFAVDSPNGRSSPLALTGICVVLHTLACRIDDHRTRQEAGTPVKSSPYQQVLQQQSSVWQSVSMCHQLPSRSCRNPPCKLSEGLANPSACCQWHFG